MRIVSQNAFLRSDIPHDFAYFILRGALVRRRLISADHDVATEDLSIRHPNCILIWRKERDGATSDPAIWKMLIDGKSSEGAPSHWEPASPVLQTSYSPQRRLWLYRLGSNSER